MAELSFQFIKPLAGKALETVLNRALIMDPDTADALKQLEGQRITLILDAPELALDICVNQGQFKIGPANTQTEADLSVRSTLSGLLGQLPWLRSNQAQSPSNKRIRISGDAELAHRIQQLARGVDLDWQQPFVRVFGQVLGVQIAQTAQRALQQAQQTGHALARNSADYLLEDSRDVLGKLELEAFYDDVDAIRDDVERIAARIARLADIYRNRQ